MSHWAFHSGTAVPGGDRAKLIAGGFDCAPARFSQTPIDELNHAGETGVGLRNQSPCNGLGADEAVGGFVSAAVNPMMEELGVSKRELQVNFCLLVAHLYRWQFPRKSNKLASATKSAVAINWQRPAQEKPKPACITSPYFAKILLSSLQTASRRWRADRCHGGKSPNVFSIWSSGSRQNACET